MHTSHDSYAETSKVHFGESLHGISERDVYASKIASQFSKDISDVEYVSSTAITSITFDWLPIHFKKT